MQEKFIRQYPKYSTDDFPNSENAEQTLTVKRIGGKLKTLQQVLRKLLIPIKGAVVEELY